jgi:hypothetical protein
MKVSMGATQSASAPLTNKRRLDDKKKAFFDFREQVLQVIDAY